LISCRKTSQTRRVKKANGISKKLTAFYIRSAKYCCGAILTTLDVKPQRYMVVVCTVMYWYINE
jgi:hypothetical protein